MNVKLFKFKQQGQPRGGGRRKWITMRKLEVEIEITEIFRQFGRIFQHFKKIGAEKGGNGGNNKCHLLIENESCGKMRTG